MPETHEVRCGNCGRVNKTVQTKGSKRCRYCYRRIDLTELNLVGDGGGHRHKAIVKIEYREEGRLIREEEVGGYIGDLDGVEKFAVAIRETFRTLKKIV